MRRLTGRAVMTDEQKRQAFNGALFLAALVSVGTFSLFWGATGNILAALGIGIVLFVGALVYLFGKALGEW